MSLGYGIDPNVRANVYHSWKSARDALSQSVQSYLNACDALTSVSINALTQSPTTWGGSVPDALSAIDTELSGLVHEEERLRKARLSLLESRNRSKASSTINIFPTEILSSIFLAAKPNPQPGSRTRYPTAISSVCRLWRQIALDLPSMWSDLHYIIDGSRQVNTSNCADLWNQRAKDAPRYVEMYQLDSGVNLDAAHDVLDWSLGAYAPRVECLYLECSRHFIQCALSCLIKEGTPGSTKVLQLHEEDTRENSNHILLWHRDIAHEAPSADRTSKFLSSIQFLDLRNTYFPWHSTAYHNLFELTLNFSAGSFSDVNRLPTQREMKTILSSSPMLHTLALTLITPLHNRQPLASSLRERQASVQPIRLNNLQNFTLKSFNSPACLGLLPLIEPGPKGLNVTVSVHSDPVFLKELRSFFRRSTTTALCIQPAKASFWFKLLSKGLPQLESLTLDSCDFRDGDLSDFFNASSTSGSHASPWPKLHTLELAGCQINGDILQRIIPIDCIRSVRFYGGSNIHPRTTATADSRASAMQELEQQLSAIVPDTKYLPHRMFSWL